jgi:hypothetical protein
MGDGIGGELPTQFARAGHDQYCSKYPANTTVPVRSSLGDYVFTAPTGWTTTRYADGIVLSSNNGENCRLTLWPMRPAGQSLANDASLLFSQVFRGLQLKQDSTAPSVVRGVSAQGWDYYLLKHGLSKPGDNYVFWGFAFVAQLSNQVACISGMSKDPLVSSCFGLMGNDVWPKFFYSLQFKNWNAAQPESAFLKKVPGVWISATATAADRWEFTPNGRFASAAAARRNDATYFGDGAYSIQGYRITLVHDDNKDSPERGLIRCEQESLDGGHTWTEKLHLLRTSAIDGSEYEVTYKKQ